MNDDAQLDKELARYFQQETIEDNGFSDDLYTQINQITEQKRSKGRLIVGLSLGMGLLSVSSLVAFSFMTLAVADLAAFTGLAIFTAYFWLEPEL